jgi:hypothetical protein
MGLLANTKTRGNEVASDMVRSIAVVLLFVVVAGMWFLFVRPHPDLVHPIDYGPELRAARSAATYHVLAPVGLPPSWRATSARHERTAGGSTVTFHLGFVTPEGRYADLDESNGDAATFVRTELGEHPSALSTITVAGSRWQQLRAAHGELALARQNGGVTVLVHGSAAIAELTRLAGALR